MDRRSITKEFRASAAAERRCRVVVFGADALRFDLALKLWQDWSGGLSTLNRPLCCLSGGGQSVTQPGWADIWTGLPAVYHKFPENGTRAVMLEDLHIMAKLMDELVGTDFYVGWVVGKGIGLLDGEDPLSSHHPVYKRVVVEGHLGTYVGDEERSDADVYTLGRDVLQEAVHHDNYCCFVHFRNPDAVGHNTESLSSYVQAALLVDDYIRQLVQLLPPDADVIYCSDHGFNFTELGEVESSHAFAPEGVLATSFSTIPYWNVTRQTVGRLIYSRAGGDPDHCQTPIRDYAMYGREIG